MGFKKKGGHNYSEYRQSSIRNPNSSKDKSPNVNNKSYAKIARDLGLYANIGYDIVRIVNSDVCRRVDGTVNKSAFGRELAKRYPDVFRETKYTSEAVNKCILNEGGLWTRCFNLIISNMAEDLTFNMYLSAMADDDVKMADKKIALDAVKDYIESSKPVSVDNNTDNISPVLEELVGITCQK